jgi:hypothetical protein
VDRFSERIGVSKKSKTIQIEGMSDELRNSIWNFFFNLYDRPDNRGEDYWVRVANHIAEFFRKVPKDNLPFRSYDCRDWVKAYFNKLDWAEVYDLTEFLVQNHSIMTKTYFRNIGTYHHHPVDESELISGLNELLERELSGYRLVSGFLTPISDKVEVDEIETAIDKARGRGLLGTHEHIRTALQQLGKKPTPDYRNAIKEAINAVESIVKQISGKESPGLEGALKELSKNIEIHGALRSGFIKLYGYSSDEDGIRHPILNQPNAGFDEAKFMIVACSAFVNFLISKAEAAGFFKNT